MQVPDCRVDLRVDSTDGTEDFVQDASRPQWPVKAGLGEAKQAVTQSVRYEDASIEERGVHRAYASFARLSASAASYAPGSSS
jgi:hypothetical protein